MYTEWHKETVLVIAIFGISLSYRWAAGNVNGAKSA